MNTNSTAKARTRDIYWRQRRESPAFRALMRAMEARLWERHGPLPRPALDLGCGDGHFASTVWGRLDAGVDVDESALARARARNVYDRAVRADASHLPFADASFACVVSNSVLEHIPELDPVLAEAHRVLRAGGALMVTVPTDRLNEGLAGVRALEAMGATAAARRYRAWFARMQRHRHLLPPEEWRRRVEAAGFRVTRCAGYFPRAAGAWFDALHVAGVPDLLTRRLFGRWVVLPWRPLFRFEERIFARHIGADDPPDAGGCFLAAEREERAP